MTFHTPVCQRSLPGEPETSSGTPHGPACLGMGAFYKMRALTSRGDASLPKLLGSSFPFCVKAIKGNCLPREKTGACRVSYRWVCFTNRRCIHSSYLCTPAAKRLLTPPLTNVSTTWLHLYPPGAGSAPSG